VKGVWSAGVARGVELGGGVERCRFERRARSSVRAAGELLRAFGARSSFIALRPPGSGNPADAFALRARRPSKLLRSARSSFKSCRVRAAGKVTCKLLRSRLRRSARSYFKLPRFSRRPFLTLLSILALLAHLALLARLALLAILVHLAHLVQLALLSLLSLLALLELVGELVCGVGSE